MSMETLREVTSWAFLLPGAVFCLIGALGLLRLPDTYSRMHGAGVLDTLGAALILLGLLFEPSDWIDRVKLVAILFFLYVTSSTATHALGHAAWTSGYDPTADESVSGQGSTGA